MTMSRFSLIPVLLGIFLFFTPIVSAANITALSKGGQSLLLYKDYYALVIGVSNYQKWPKIPFAIQDAREVAERLEHLGFKTKLVLDPTHREMLTALTEMVYVMGRDENRALLLYYAGHGDTETMADKTKMGYIIPKDCPLLKDDPMGFATHAVSMREIESISLRIRSKHVLMLFDSCFSGSLFALVRAVPHDITEKSTLPVRQYITAGSEDEEVPDRSVFKRCFLIALEGDADLTGDGYITGSELGMYLADKVVNYTNRQQHPQYGKINNPDLDRGDFIFVPPKREQKRVTVDKAVVEERSTVAEELKLLRDERKRNEELAVELKKLLQEREQSGKTAASDQKEKLELETKLKEAQKDSKVTGEAMTSRIKELEGKLSSAEDRARKETQQEKEIKGPQVASIPQGTAETKFQRIALRSVPTSLGDRDIKSMIEKFNFPLQASNPKGQFPRDYVDNGDGTVTDKITGLVWEKEGASSLYYWDAQKRIENLNDQKLGGHGNWRIPTLEELCSLLDSKSNPQGYYIPSVFGNPQGVCWTSDIKEFPYVNSAGKPRFTVGFSKAEISYAQSEHGPTGPDKSPKRLYLKAVRTEMQPRMTAKAERPVPADSAKAGKDSRVALLPEETKSDVIQKMKLRDRAEMNLSDQDVEIMLKQRNLFSRSHNPKGIFPNSFADNEDGTITDKVTGLMWQKGGSPSDLTFYTAQKHVQDLNEKRFGGHREWRLPTVEELCSLLKAEPNNEKLHIDRLFESAQRACWSSDLSAQSVQSGGHRSRSAFVVDFAMGDLRIDGADVWSQTRRYVRAVRTIE